MSNGWTGATIIEGGVLQVGGLAAINTNSSIGKGSAADPVIAGGTLRYAGTGGATTTNRLFTIGNANGLTATLDSSSATTANTISFTGTGALGMGGSGTRTLTLTGTNIGDNTLASIIGDGSGGTTSVNKTGIGKWVLSGANTYTGTTKVDSGILQLNRATADSSAIPTDGVLGTSGDIVINGGTLQILQSEQIGNTGSITLTSGAFNLGSATGKTETIGTFTTGANTLIGTGNTVTWASGTNTVNNGGNVQDAHIVISGGTNTVEGGATGGVLQLLTGGTGLEMSAGSTLTLNSDNAVAGKLLLQGSISVTGNSTVTIVSGLSNTNKGTVDLGTGTRTFTVADGTAATDLLISAVITNGALTKDGAGTMALAGTNTYAGQTTVSGGTLGVDNNGSTTAGRITGSTAADSIKVNSTGTLLLAGSGSADRLNNAAGVTLAGGTLSMQDLSSSTETMGLLTLSANSTLDFGTGDGNRLIFSGLALGSHTLSIYNWSGTRYTLGQGDPGTPLSQDRLIFTSDVSGQPLGQINFYSGGSGSPWVGFGSQIDFGNPANSFEVVPVPEPATIFGALALLGLIGWRERRRFRQVRETLK